MYWSPCHFKRWATEAARELNLSVQSLNRYEGYMLYHRTRRHAVSDVTLERYVYVFLCVIYGTRCSTNVLLL